jgi:AraC-like DNA-binding protein
MLYEPTTLAALTKLLATVLRKDYEVDPQPIFAAAGIDLDQPSSPQQRYPLPKIRKLWKLARNATGDDAIGLRVGQQATPAQFYALGCAWMASSTLLDAMQRLVRYHRLLSTVAVQISINEQDDCYVLSTTFPDKSRCPPKEGIDCSMTALLALCDLATGKDIRPLRVDLISAATVRPDEYRKALRAPINFSSEVGSFYFDKGIMLCRLQHDAPEIVKATDRIAEQYIESLEPDKVASQVRRLLIALLPSGKTDQTQVSNRMNRSVSTLQRQLQLEGSSYRDVLESTRRSLAEDYLREHKHSQAQIAYLLGFSDQSNFSRAFKRWTNLGPKEFQERYQ